MPYTDAVQPAPVASRNLHVEGISTGDLYFAPLRAHEDIVLVSIDAATGARRWAITGTGAPAGSSAPMVLRDPETAGQEIFYLALYDRVLAVRTDGSIVWDAPNGLALSPALGTVRGRQALSARRVCPRRATLPLASMRASLARAPHKRARPPAMR